MEKIENNNIKELERELKQSQLKNYILEEENSLLRESVECLLLDLENIKKDKEHINKIMSGKIYKILKRVKKIVK